MAQPIVLPDYGMIRITFAIVRGYSGRHTAYPGKPHAQKRIVEMSSDSGATWHVVEHIANPVFDAVCERMNEERGMRYELQR